SKNAPMPVSNSTVAPLSGVASSARVARRMRLSASGVAQRVHIARGALPNIEPPSSHWVLPSIDHSFMAGSGSVAGARRGGVHGFHGFHGFHGGLADRIARVRTAVEAVVGQAPLHRLQV